MGRDRAPWRKGGLALPQAPSPEGRAAAQSLARSLNPLASAVALGAIDDPLGWTTITEALQAHGFGDAALDGMAKEIIRLRLTADALDSRVCAAI